MALGGAPPKESKKESPCWPDLSQHGDLCCSLMLGRIDTLSNSDEFCCNFADFFSSLELEPLGLYGA